MTETGFDDWLSGVFGEENCHHQAAQSGYHGEPTAYDLWTVASMTPVGRRHLTYLRRLFREAGSITAHLTDEQVALGLYGISTAGTYTGALLMTSSPWHEVEPALLDVYFLFRDVFAPRCADAKPATRRLLPGPRAHAWRELAKNLPWVCEHWWGCLLDLDDKSTGPCGDLAPALDRLLLGMYGRVYALPCGSCRSAVDAGLVLLGWFRPDELAALAARILRRHPEMATRRRKLYESMVAMPPPAAKEAGPEGAEPFVGALELKLLRGCLLRADAAPAGAVETGSSKELALAYGRRWTDFLSAILPDRACLARIASTPAILTRLLRCYDYPLRTPAGAPWLVQERCWRSMPELFRKLFGPVCGDVLPWDEGAGRLHNLCVWFWWLVPCPALVVDQALACRLDALQLELIRETLAMPWESCQAAGLKGLLLRALHDQPGVGDALDWYLTREPSARMQQLAAEVREYAEAFGAT